MQPSHVQLFVQPFVSCYMCRTHLEYESRWTMVASLLAQMCFKMVSC